MKKHVTDISSYRATYLECRVGMSGHNWKWDTDFKILRNTRGVITEFSRARHCTRCQSKNVKVYDGQTGRVLRRSYEYVDGYMTDKDHAIQPGMAVLEALRRSMEKGKAEEA
jgi:hypothetical protein